MLKGGQYQHPKLIEYMGRYHYMRLGEWMAMENELKL